MFSVTLTGAAISGCLKTGTSGLLEGTSTGLRLGEGGSDLLRGGSGILEVGVGLGWESNLRGGAGGSCGRERPISARLCVELVVELSAAARLPRLWTSGLFRPKRAIPGLGELSTCLEDTSMEISARRADVESGARPPGSSMRLRLLLGERGLEDSDGEVLEE